MAENHARSLEGWRQHPEAVIPVERISGRVFLVCGELDRVWPGCPMARQIQERSRERHRPDVTLLAYGDGGHLAFGALPLRPDNPGLTSAGGTVDGNNAARSDSWKKAVAFLKAALER